MIRASNKGLVKRTEEQQAQLAVRIMDERHAQDVIKRTEEELGSRANVIGPIDLTRNPLRGYVGRVNRAHTSPPFVADLTAEMADLIGDQSGAVLRRRYQAAGGLPMPTDQQRVSHEAMGYWLGSSQPSGVMLGWASGPGRVWLHVVTPDDIKLVYGGGDPLEPSIIRHSRTRDVAGKPRQVVDEYDLSDPERPVFRILDGTTEVTDAAMTEEEAAALRAWPWRYQDGTPFHRIVIVGNPARPYRTNQLIEGTLRICVDWTHWHAAVRDAGHPQRNAIGLTLRSMESDSETREAGVATGPETVLVWDHDDPERPGTLHQWGPGHDPEVTGRAIRSYELGLWTAMGLPVDYESTGGDPTEQERRALEEIIRATYADARRLDSEILRRCAAVIRVQGAGTFSEEPYGVLYRDEVEVVLTEARTTQEMTDGQRTDDREPAPGDPDPADEGEPDADG